MPASPEGAAQFYDDMWGRYGHLDAASPAAFHRRRLVVELCRRHAPSARSILDAGCGRGELLGELGRAFPNAERSASDVSDKSVRLTARAEPSLDVFQMDLSRADFEIAYAARLGRFELITCSEVLEHLPNDRLALKRLVSLLAPRGTLIVTVPGGKMSRFDELIGHQRHYSSQALLDLAREAKLDVIELLAWGFPFQNVYRTAVRLASRWTMPPTSEPVPAAARDGVSGALGAAYTWFGRAFRPLFYLNRNYWGEQMLLVARPRG